MDKAITWRELKTLAVSLSEAQLDLKVMWCAEDDGGVVTQVEILDEDHINPSGDVWEPRSHYGAGADYEDEEIVAVKGQPVLHVD